MLTYTWGRGKQGQLGYDTKSAANPIIVRFYVKRQQVQQSCNHQNGNGKHKENGNATNGHRKLLNKPQRHKQPRNNKYKMQDKHKQTNGAPPLSCSFLPLSIKRVACGGDFTVCVDTENVIWTWGNPNWIGRDGYNNTIHTYFQIY